MTQEERLIAIIRAQGKLIKQYQFIVANNLMYLGISDETIGKVKELLEEIERLKTMKVEELSK
jgi:hypothetical protein